MMYWLLFLTAGGLMTMASGNWVFFAGAMFLAGLVVPSEGSLRSTWAQVCNAGMVLVLAFLCVCLLVYIRGGA